jgi:hypothetical protein
MNRKPIGLSVPHRPVIDKSAAKRIATVLGWEPAKLIRGVRVEDDKVIITVKGGNEAARHLCGELLKEKEK